MAKWTAERRARQEATVAARNAKNAAMVDEIAGVTVPPRETKAKVKSEQPAAPPMNLFSGDVRKLQVFGRDGNEGIPGFKTRWFADEGGSGVRINMARRSGWDFVTREEVALNDSLTPLNSDLGNHVTQVVNPHAEGGKPEIGYLMKIPEDLFKSYQDEREQKVHGNIERALREGAMNRGPEARQFAAGSDIARATHSSLPNIEMGTKNYR